MLSPTNQAIRFYAHFTESKVGKTGLTVTVDVYRGTTLIVTGGAATEIGGGLYTYQLAAGSTGTAEGYTAVFKTATATVDQQHIPALWIIGEGESAGLSAAAGNTGGLAVHGDGPSAGELAAAIAGTVNVNVNSPVTAGTMELVRGDAYQQAEGTAISQAKTANDVSWPTTLLSVHLEIKIDPKYAVGQPDAFAGYYDGTAIACAVTDDTGSDQAWRLELSAAQTVALTAGAEYRFWFVANKATQRKSLRRGTLTVVADPTSET